MMKIRHFATPTQPEISVNYHHGAAKFAEHTHDSIELLIVVKGKAVHIVNGYPYPITAGDVYVINCGTKHGMKDSQTLEECLVVFKPELLHSLDVDLRALSAFHTLFVLAPKDPDTNFTCHLRLKPADRTKALLLANRIKSESQEHHEGYHALTRALLTELIIFLCRKYIEPKDPADNARSVLQLAQVTSQLEANYRQPLTLNEIAAFGKTSRRHLTRLFRKAYHQSPMEYLLKLRLKHAAVLLIHSDELITEIAFDCGFSDSNYFARQFRKVMGLSPSEYRSSRIRMFALP